MNPITEEVKEFASSNFETLKYNLANESDDILLDSTCDTDLNFFNKYVKNFGTKYLSPEDFKDFIERPVTNLFSILHLNIRSIKKNFDNFKKILCSLDFTFSVICFSETWPDKLDSFTYNLLNYTSIHQKRSHRKGGGVSIYIHNSLNFISRPDLSINCDDIESLTLEIISDNTRNTLMNVLYRPPKEKFETFESFLTNFLVKIKNSNKNIHIAGGFNLNLLDHGNNKKVQTYLNLIYQSGLIPTINKPTRVTRKTATIIDHILANSFLDTNFQTMIFKADISDHFSICFLLQSTMPKIENKVTYITRRITKQDAIEKFNQDLYKISWDDIIKNKNPNEAYNMFLQKVKVLYDQYFPKQFIKIKEKDLRSPWITRGIKKSSKRKQKLYNKFLKNRNNKDEYEYKNYKNYLNPLKNERNGIIFQV